MLVLDVELVLLVEPPLVEVLLDVGVGDAVIEAGGDAPPLEVEVDPVLEVDVELVVEPVAPPGGSGSPHQTSPHSVVTLSLIHI